MSDRIYLGIGKNKIEKDHNKDTYIEGEKIWIEKHSWDCGWYWGFGYVGNAHLHCHAEQQFLGKNIWLNPDEIFEKTWITEKLWWVVKDLLKQAYALRECAEVYRHGGYCTTAKGTTDIIIDKEMENRINADLKKILDKLWEVLETRKI